MLKTFELRQLPEREARAAEEEAAAARQVLEALEERVRAGEDVPASELVEARELVRIAELKVEAARRRGEQLVREHLAEETRRLRQDAEALAEGVISDAALAEAFREAVAATGRLAALARERRERLEEFARRAESVQANYQALLGVSSSEFRQAAGFTAAPDALAVDGRRLWGVPARDLVRGVCELVLSQDSSEGSQFYMALGQVVDKVPAIADALELTERERGYIKVPQSPEPLARIRDRVLGSDAS